jgi:glycosyltransferase involved in cell wall biosynthesis
MKLRIAFQMPEGLGTLWQGGVSHYENLIGALRVTHADDTDCWLAVPEGSPPPSPRLTALAQGVIYYPQLPHSSLAWAIDHAKHRALRADLVADRAFRAQDITVVFCNAPLRRTNLPTLALIPDLQHRHLPEFFSAEESRARDETFLKTIARATRVVVSTNAVRTDLEQFAPPYRDKLRVIPPEPVLPPEIYVHDPRAVTDKYGLPEKFFYLPNQLWQHKNHLLVVRALAQLRARGMLVNVVCTGALGDYRNSTLAGELLETVSRLGIRAQFILLGTVPRADVYALHRQALCVLNPSRFEGYGLSIAEARAIGKRVLVSDLPAHRALNAPCAEYFDPNAAEALADKMARIWQAASPGPALELEASARVVQRERVRQVGETLWRVASEIAAA